MPENEEVDLIKAKSAELHSTQRKVTAAKGLVTRSINKLETSCIEFSLIRTELKRHRLASEIQKSRKKVAT